MKRASGNWPGQWPLRWAIALALLDGAATRTASGGSLFAGTYGVVAVPERGAAVAVRDLNGDGSPDLLVQSAADRLHVFPGDGSGFFAESREYRGDGYPSNVTLVTSSHSLVVVDVNRDGRVDVLTSDFMYVHECLGSATGGFDGALSFDMGPNPHSVQACDLDGDGRLDIVVTNGYQGQISVRLGRGDGSFREQRAYPGGERLMESAVADLNRDGRPEVLAVGAWGGGDSVTVFWNDGAGRFPRTSTVRVGGGGDLTNITLGDLSEDGHPDLVLTRLVSSPGGLSSTSEVVVLTGSGDGSFRFAECHSGTTGSLHLLDFDGDDHLDLLQPGQSLAFYRGRGDGGLDPAVRYPSGGGGLSLAVADLNGDSRLDVVSQATTGAAILLARPEGGFDDPPRFPVPGRPRDCRLVDLNEDGRLDLVSLLEIDQDSSRLLFAPGDGRGWFGSAMTMAVPGRGPSLAIGDWNGDGHLDVATGTMVGLGGPAELDSYHGDGTGSLRPGSRMALPGRYPMLAAGDFDGDGRSDLAVTLVDTIGVLAFQSLGAGWAPPLEFQVPRGASFPVVGDFDGDSRADLAVISGRSGLSCFPGSDDGMLGQRRDLPTYGNWYGLATGDVDGDGRLDLVAASYESLRVATGRGDGTFAPPRSLRVGHGPRNVRTADLNGDGRPDIVTTLDECVAVIPGQGNGTFARTVYEGTASGIETLDFGDLDGDGRRDMVCGLTTNNIAVHRNIAAAAIPPVRATAAASGWMVQLEFEFPDSPEPGHYNLYRKSHGDPPLLLINREPLVGPLIVLTDSTVTRPGTFRYELQQVDVARWEVLVAAVEVTVSPPPAPPRLAGLWPNPAQVTALVQYELTAAADARLYVFDVAGRRVRSQPLGLLAAGRGTLAWDLRDDSGQPCAAGVYLLRLNDSRPALKLVIAR